jgi:hypothetical protein
MSIAIRFRFCLVGVVVASIAAGGLPLNAAQAKGTPQIDLTPLDVSIPVFDPGIPEDQDKWDKKGIFPELRRAEARHMAVQLAKALQTSGHWGTVKVVPSEDVVSDLVIYATIDKSTGSEVSIDLEAIDSRGKSILKKNFKYKVEPYFYEDTRNGGKEAYEPVFHMISAELYKKASSLKLKHVQEIKSVTQIRYAQQFAPMAFEGALKETRGPKYKIIRKPAENDPMIARVEMIRLRDQMFIDTVQDTFYDFARNMDDDYLLWRKQYSVEYMAMKKAKAQARTRMIVGALLAVGGAAAAGSSNSSWGQAAAIGAAASGVAVISSGVRKNREAKAYRAVVEEMGRSVNSTMASQVVEIEGQTETLTGTIDEQFAQWRTLLGKVYFSETSASDAGW